MHLQIIDLASGTLIVATLMYAICVFHIWFYYFQGLEDETDFGHFEDGMYVVVI